MDMDRMIAMHSQELDTLHNLKIDESTSSSASQGTVTAPKSNGTISDTPNLKVKNFGSWEPKEFESSFGTGKIVGPVGYYISWNSRPAEEGQEPVEVLEVLPVKGWRPVLNRLKQTYNLYFFVS